jgi:hypothetical protein
VDGQCGRTAFKVITAMARRRNVQARDPTNPSWSLGSWD